MTKRYTVQHTQYGVSLLDDTETIEQARQIFAEVCADPTTTEAWIFDGTHDGAECIEDYRRKEDSK